MTIFTIELNFYSKRVKYSIDPLLETYLICLDGQYTGNLYRSSETERWESTWLGPRDLIVALGMSVEERIREGKMGIK